MATRTIASESAAARRAEADAESLPEFMIPKEIYLDPEIARLEKERLWPKV